MEIPKIGLGTFGLNEKSIRDALDIGYRLLDTAWQYKNEKDVGNALKKSGIPRDKIFITTKLWTDSIRANKVREEFEESLRNLQLDYIDLYLIHWPAEGFEQAWENMLRLKQEGRVKLIGVSNFEAHHFEKLAKVSCEIPLLNQIECHPFFQNKELIEWCQKREIVTQAWCPLGGPFSKIVDEGLFKQLSGKYNKTPAQIILKWHLQNNMFIIPRSSNIKRLKENLDLFDFELEFEDMEKINLLDTGKRIGANPNKFDF